MAEESVRLRNIEDERVLITGITGIHGWPLFRLLQKMLPGDRLVGIGPPGMRMPTGDAVVQCCVADMQRLAEIKKRFAPTLVIHAAGVCDLDVCEERPRWADLINRQGTAVLAELFSDAARFVYLSTDLVFSGNAPPAGGYAEHHQPDPVSVAGKTFLAGERELLTRSPACTIIRLGLPMGASVTHDKGGLDWIEGRFRKNRRVTLFSDEFRSVLSTKDAARCVVECIAGELRGVFHLGGPESLSLHQLGSMIIAGGGYRQDLLDGILRCEEKNGPPRIGDVTLNSGKIARHLSRPPSGWRYGME